MKTWFDFCLPYLPKSSTGAQDDETAADKFIDAALANLHTATSPNQVPSGGNSRGMHIRNV